MIDSNKRKADQFEIAELVNELVSEKLAKIIHGEQSQFSRMTDSEYTKYIELNLKNDIEEIPIVAEQLSLLTEAQQNQFDLIQNEHKLIAELTPTLFDFCIESKRNFVNSEEEKWIQTLLQHPDNYLKPDCFSGLDLLYIHGNHHSPYLNDIRANYPGKYLFGKGIWELRDYYILWEFKIRISPADRGIAYNYATHISRGDKFNKYFVILADAKDFYIIEAIEKVISVKHSNWISPGSKNTIQKVINYRNHSLHLLEQLCHELQIQVINYLGTGGYGRCFTVKTDDERIMALKVVQVINREKNIELLVKNEFFKLSELINVDNVIQVVPNSLTTIYQDNDIIGIGYLMAQVGITLNREDCKSINLLTKLLYSLRNLHIKNIYHGDARYNNAILINNEIVWIDFVAGFKSSDFQHQQYFIDIRLLICSIFGENIITEVLKQLLIQYSKLFDNINNIIENLSTI